MLAEFLGRLSRKEEHSKLQFLVLRRSMDSGDAGSLRIPTTRDETVNTGIDSIHVWAILSRYYPNFAGDAIQAHRVLSILARQGFDVTVLTPGYDEASSLAGKENRRDGITIRYLSAIPRKDWSRLIRLPWLHRVMAYLNGLLIQFALGIGYAYRLWRSGKRHDIVQFYSTNEFSFIPMWIARAEGMHPVIKMSLLGSDDPGAHIKRVRRGNILASLTLVSYRSSETVIGLSTALTKSYCEAKLDQDRILRIPNGVDLRRFKPVSIGQQRDVRQSLGLRIDRRYIVFVGSALYRKGIDVLIRAFVDVAAELEDVDLLIVGICDFVKRSFPEPEKQRLVDDLKEELAQSGLALRVHWIGLVGNPHEYLQAADIFCFPTRREGLPNVVGEAMGVGLPIVLSRVEGITTDFFLSEGEGVLITGYAPGDYAEALLCLLGDPARAKAMGHAARSRAEAEFSLDRIAHRYIQLYRRLAGVTHTKGD